MTAFWIGAALLGLAAAAFVLVPVWRERSRSGRWSLTGLAAALATLPVGVLVYLNVTTFDPEAAAPPGNPEQNEAVARLAEELERNPDNAEGWRLLGRSYMALGDYVRGRRALTEAWQRTPEPDTALKLALAESMILSDRSMLGGEAGALIDEVLSREPRNQTALWYGGWVAFERGRADLARERWSALLEMNPPPDIAELLRNQIAQLAAAAPGGAASGGIAGGAAARPEAAEEGAAGPRIELEVRVADALSLEDLGPQARLFIFARAPGGGPPVAAINEPLDRLPGEFTLSDADAMLPGRSLADYPELVLVARVSASGQATAQPGDYEAQASYRRGEDGAIELVIDEVVR